MNKNIKYIIYIGTIHKLNPNDDVYILHENKQSTFKLPDSINQKPIPYDEHSFAWVENEIRTYFKNAEILAFGPNKYNKALKNWIVSFMKTHTDCILFSTTDLIHYGENFNNVNYLEYQEQLKKQEKEQKLINELVQKPLKPTTINNIIDSDKNLMCGPEAIKLFVCVIKDLDYSGKVVDYYDSHNSKKEDLLNRYTIFPEQVAHLVSYVSIIYGKNVNQEEINDFDIMMAIANVKSNVLANVYGENYDVNLSSWSPFTKRIHGVFVGTSINGDTNCSYGRYENGTNSSIKIKEASLDCKGDAENRWNNPYNKEDMDDVEYKVELLQSKKDWEELNNKLNFPLDGKHGMYLTLPSGSSATYLPVVAREAQDWTIEDYLESLSEKANGHKNEWQDPDAKALKYKSESYIWNPKKQKLIKLK